MGTITHWKQANSDYAVPQPGAYGVSEAGVVTGATSGEPNFHQWKNIRWALAQYDPQFIAIHDEFLGDAIADAWDTDDDGASGTIAIQSSTHGIARLTTGGASGNHATLAYGLHWDVSNGDVNFRAYVASATAVASRVIEIGLSDAVSETEGLAFSNHSLASVASVADDAAVFAFDTGDVTTTNWVACTSRDEATDVVSAVDTGVAPTADEFQLFEIRIRSTGDATFWINGSQVASVSEAVNADSILTPWVSVSTLAASAVSVDVDYVSTMGYRG